MIACVLVLVLAVLFTVVYSRTAQIKAANSSVEGVAQAAGLLHACVVRVTDAHRGLEDLARVADLRSFYRAVNELERLPPACTLEEAKQRAASVLAGLRTISFLLTEHTKDGMPVARALAAVPGGTEDFMRHLRIFKAKVDQFHLAAPPCDC